MKNWDVIIIGGGVIGLTLALRLRDEHLSVLVVERHEPADEATHAAGGMIARCDPHTSPQLQPLADASAEMYPEFVKELEAESGESADLRDAGTIAFFPSGEAPTHAGVRELSDDELQRIEPALASETEWQISCLYSDAEATLRQPTVTLPDRLRAAPGPAWYLPELCVDPRRLGRALTKTCRKRSVDFATGSEAVEVLTAGGSAIGVRTSHASYHSAVVVNCAGAWAANIAPLSIPTRPVKGQMVCVVPQISTPNAAPLIRHVIRTPKVYIIPRSDGRIVLGATVEEAGFDKRVDPRTVQRLYQAALKVAPVLSKTRIHDAWAGLRPGSPDDLPILGETSIPSYFAATGHFRDGIMLAPITANLMTQLVTGIKPSLDLAPFSPLRFALPLSS